MGGACISRVQETKRRDFLPTLGRKFLKESSERVLEPRLSLRDAGGVEYVIALKRDHVKAVCDPVEGRSHCLLKLRDRHASVIKSRPCAIVKCHRERKRLSFFESVFVSALFEEHPNVFSSLVFKKNICKSLHNPNVVFLLMIGLCGDVQEFWPNFPSVRT